MSFLQSIRSATRASAHLPTRAHAQQSMRLAHGSYGNSQSGQAKSDAPNPREDLEHPGPEAPASKGKSSSSSTSSSTSKQSNESAPSTSKGGSPKIHHPESPQEANDPEVRKHNEDMRNRSEQSVNQLGHEDNKVDKDFWKGDVGPKEK